MRIRRVLVVVALAALALTPALARADGPWPTNLPQDACQPNPADPNPQVLHCRYGPLTISPGNNLILFGPVSIESPRAFGYLTSFKPDLVYAAGLHAGEIPPIHIVHLHHGVWLDVTHDGQTPFAATGEEKTVAQIPAGYGYRITPYDQWVLNYMLHNLTGNTYSVFITYDVGWTPDATATAVGMKQVRPVWMDTVGGAYPIYNPALADRRPDATAPSGLSIARTATFAIPQDMEMVWVGGHVHPGGLRDELHASSCGGSVAGAPLLFNSQAKLNDRADTSRSFGSWDFRMTVSQPTWRYAVHSGDRVSVTTYYDAGHPFYEAMGIMFAWAHYLAPGEQPSVPFCQTPPTLLTTGNVTGDLPADPVFGGTTATYPDPATVTPTAAPGSTVHVATFGYYPSAVAVSKSSPTVTFVNEDASAQIFHTVTSCTYPCNLDYGQSYPLASWGFDSSQGPRGFGGAPSGELGFGPPLATAAANTDRWSYTLPSTAQVGDIYTFFCRIHPSMRGFLEVVS